MQREFHPSMSFNAFYVLKKMLVNNCNLILIPFCLRFKNIHFYPYL
jgi:hypothetical protein